MGTGTVLLIVAALAVAVAAATSLRHVPTGSTAVIERLGRFHRLCGPGRTFLVPGVDTVRATVGTSPRVEDFSVTANTADGRQARIDVTVRYLIVDPRAVTYRISDHRQGLELVAAAALREVVGGLSLADAPTARRRVESAVHRGLTEAGDRWGLRIERTDATAVGAAEPGASTHPGGGSG